MDALKEIGRRDRRIENDKKMIEELREEIVALRQLLDCAAANIAMLVKDGGGVKKISKKDVSESLGKYRLCAKCDSDGNYILETVAEIK